MRLEVSRLRLKCQKVEVKHTLSRSSDLVSTNEAGECEGKCLGREYLKTVCI